MKQGLCLVPLASAKKSGKLFARPTSAKRAYLTKRTSSCSLTSVLPRSTTCSDCRRQRSSLMCSMRDAMACWTKTNRFWFSLRSRKRCSCLGQSAVKSTSIRCTRISWGRCDCLKQILSSTKTSCARTFRRPRCANMWQSATRCCKISTSSGRVNSKNLRTIHF